MIQLHNINENENIEAIKNGDISKLNKLLLKQGIISEHMQMEFVSFTDFINYCKSVDLSIFLGLEKKNCKCIFHDDQDESASVFKIENDFIYKCHSSNCKTYGSSMNIFGITMKVTDTTFYQTVVFLSQALNCVCDFSLLIKKNNVQDIIQSNNELLSQLDKYAPTAKKLLGNDILPLYALNSIAYQRIEYCTNSNEIITGESNNYLRKYMNSDNAKISKSLALLAYVGLIRRVPLYEIPTTRLEKIKKLSRNCEKPKLRVVNQVGIKKLTETDFKEIEENAKRWYSHKYIKKTFTHETVNNVEDAFVAHRLFSQI